MPCVTRQAVRGVPIDTPALLKRPAQAEGRARSRELARKKD